MSQGPLCPNLSQKVQKEVSQMANRNLFVWRSAQVYIYNIIEYADSELTFAVVGVCSPEIN